MQQEIGGYIELDLSSRSQLHPDAIKLNCGRDALEYFIRAKKVASVALPDFNCDSVANRIKRLGVDITYYHVDLNLRPILHFELAEDEFLYVVDYFGQLTDKEIDELRVFSHNRLLVDCAQSLFRDRVEDVATLYSARKFLGVSDGGYLYCDAVLQKNISVARSAQDMSFLLGRVEEPASNYYSLYAVNNDRFENAPMQRMSKLTAKLISNLDLDDIKKKRTENFCYLHSKLKSINELELHEVEGAFCYPLLIKGGSEIRKKLIERKIYIPTFWSNVLAEDHVGEDAHYLAENLLPLPVDQRYSFAEMDAIIDALRELGVYKHPLAGKSVAILGGTLISCEIVREAKKMGLTTYVIDYNTPENSPAKQICDYHAQISVADTDEVAAYINEHHIDGVICGYADSILEYYAEICEKASKPCYGTKHQFDLFTNKELWKEKCLEYGIPTAKPYESDILDLSEEELPLPLFVKPKVGSGALGTAIVRTKQELLDAYAAADEVSKGSGVLIEDYLEGPEVTIFWAMIDGRFYVTQAGNRLVKHNQEGVIPLPTGYTFPAAVIPHYLNEIAPRFKKLFEDEGVKNGMMFMQCIEQHGTALVYDIGYRLTGSLEHHLTQAAAGYNIMEMLLTFAVTGSMTFDADIEEKINRGLYAPVFNISTLMAPGTIDHFEGIDVIENSPEVVDYIKAHVEGETLPLEAKGQLRQISLRTLGTVEHSRDLAPLMMSLQDTLHVFSPEGNDLALSGFEYKDVSERVLDV